MRTLLRWWRDRKLREERRVDAWYAEWERLAERVPCTCDSELRTPWLHKAHCPRWLAMPAQSRAAAVRIPWLGLHLAHFNSSPRRG